MAMCSIHKVQNHQGVSTCGEATSNRRFVCDRGSTKYNSADSSGGAVVPCAHRDRIQPPRPQTARPARPQAFSCAAALPL
eukprot:6213400-Pleurochrysis_carterae.AAC.8